MDALELLKNDHDKVKQLFQRFQSIKDESDHRKMFEEIKTELQAHTHIEESIFYPAVEKFEELEDLVSESLEEHSTVKDLIDEIDGMNKDGEDLRPAVMELIESVEHHAEEEENEMFPKLRELMDRQELERLGKELEDEKKSYGQMAA